MAYAKGMQKYTVQESQNIGLGQSGYDYVTNATVNADTYIAVTSLGTTSGVGAATLTLTSEDTDYWDTCTTIEVPAGVTIYGRWSGVTVGSGDAAIVYRG